MKEFLEENGRSSNKICDLVKGWECECLKERNLVILKRMSV